MKAKARWVPYLAVATTVVAGSLTSASLAHATSPQLREVPFSVRLEDQLLATLRYLPVKFVPTARPTTTTTTTTSTTTTTLPSSSTTSTTTTTLPTSTTTSTTTTTRPVHKTPVDPAKLVAGNFVWQYSSLATLRTQWSVGTNNVVLRGALMHFQYVHGLSTTGNIDASTWRALTSAVRQHQVDPASYDYVYVSKTLPEKVKLYVNGRHTFTSFANTGISVAQTANGTYPVYLRFVTTTMSGTLPDGKPYSDSGIPWVSYFNGGDALHGFIRSSYGWPQSLGCVEMPFAEAKVLWPMTPIGTLVTVQ